MSRMFDSEVYATRRRFPFAEVSIAPLMEEACMRECTEEWRGEDKSDEARLTCYYRHSVASRIWWTLSFVGEDGKRREISAQKFDLLCWRAQCLENLIKRQIEIEKQPSSWRGDLDLIEGAGI